MHRSTVLSAANLEMMRDPSPTPQPSMSTLQSLSKGQRVELYAQNDSEPTMAMILQVHRVGYGNTLTSAPASTILHVTVEKEDSSKEQLMVPLALIARVVDNRQATPRNATGGGRPRRLRDRSILLGRCNVCGALRKDCGSCSIDRMPLSSLEEPTISADTPGPTTARPPNETDSSGSDSDDLLENLRQRHRDHLRLKRRVYKSLGVISPKKRSTRENDAKKRKSLKRRRDQIDSLARPPPSPSEVFAVSTETCQTPVGLVDDSFGTTELTQSESLPLDIEPSPYHPTNGYYDDGSDESEDSALGMIQHGSDSDHFEADRQDQDSDSEFIQPEGDAQLFPAEIKDRSVGLPFDRLGTELDRRLKELEKRLIPESQRRIVSSPLETCNLLYIELVHILIREGVDQCKMILKKLSSSKKFHDFYRGRSVVPPRRTLQLEMRSLRLDSVVQQVDECMTQLRMRLRSIPPVENAINDGIDSDNGWADPQGDNEVSPPRVGFQEDEDNDDIPLASLGPMVTHPFAQVVRKSRKKCMQHPNRGKFSASKQNGRHSKQIARRSNVLVESANRCREVSIEASEPTKRTYRKQTAPIELDELLGMHCTDGIGVEDATSSTGNVTEQPSARVRMEQFLSANATGTLELSRSVKTKKHRRVDMWGRRMEEKENTGRRLRSRKETRFGTISASDDSDEDMPPEGVGSVATRLRDAFLEALPGRPHQPADSRRNRSGTSNVNTGELCGLVKETFPKAGSVRLLQSMVTVAQTDSKEAPLLLEVCLDLLQQQGYPLLQEVVALKSSGLGAHVALLVAILRILKCLSHLDSLDDDAVFKPLSGNNREHFLYHMVQQLVDSLYALSHPVAWALHLADQDRAGIFHQLQPLCVALVDHFPLLIERVSACVKSELGVQAWRCVNPRKALFVSSLDPSSWEDLMEIGKAPQRTVKSRFANFGDSLPKDEADAVWCIIAFVAKVSLSTIVPADAKHMERWMLASFVLKRGVLATDDGNPTPPCNDQILAAANEVRLLARLTLSGAMADIPRKDNVLGDIIFHAVSLQADGLVRDSPIPRGIGVKHALALWNNSFDKYMNEFPTTSIQYLTAAMTSKEHMSELDLLSRAPLFRACAGFLVSWLIALPFENPKRWELLDRSTKMLSKSLSMRANKILPRDQTQGEYDLFEQAFGNSDDEPTCSRASKISSFLKECSAFLRILTLTRNGERFSREEFIKQCQDICNLVSFGDSTNDSTQEVASQGTAEQAVVTGRVVTALILLVLEFSPFRIDQPEEFSSGCAPFDTEALALLFANLFISLDCTIRLHQSSNMNLLFVLTGSVVQLLIVRIEQGHIQKNDFAVSQLLSSVFRRSLAATTSAVSQLVAKPLCSDPEDVCMLSAFRLLNTAMQLGVFFGPEDRISRDKLLTFLLSVVEKSKPSSRYNFDQQVSDALDISAQGQLLVDRRVEIVCSEIARLAARDGIDEVTVGMLKPVLVKATVKDDQDKLFERKVRSSVTLTICELCARFDCSSLVLQRYQFDVLLTLAESMMDVSILRKLPSSNLSRIRARSSAMVYQKAQDELAKFAEGNSSTRIRSTQVWLRLRSFGDHITDHRLRNLAIDAQSSQQLAPSVEQEVVNRFRFLRDLLQYSFLDAQPVVDPPKLAAMIISTGSGELLRLLKLLSIELKAGQGSSTPSHRFVSLYETTTCYTELYVAILSLISRLGKRHTTAPFWTHVFNLLPMPIMRGVNVDIATCLKNVQNACEEFASNQKFSTESTHQIGSNPNTVELNKLVADSLLRNGRSFLLAFEKVSALLYAFLFAEIDYTDKDRAILISRLFNTNPESLPTRSLESPVLSMMEKASRFELDEAQVAVLEKLKQDTVHIILGRMKAAQKHDKVLFMHVSEKLIRADRFVSSNPASIFDMVTKLTRSLVEQTKMALAAVQVDEDLLGAAVSCATATLNLSTTTEGTESFARWSLRCQKMDKRAYYTVAAFDLLHEICSKVVEEDNQMISEYRRALKDKQETHLVSVLWKIDQEMKTAEDALMQPSGLPTVRNVYAKHTQQHTESGEQMVWKTTQDIHSLARAFATKWSTERRQYETA